MYFLYFTHSHSLASMLENQRRESHLLLLLLKTKKQRFLISGAANSAASLRPLVVSKFKLWRLTRVKPEGVCLQEQEFMGYTRSKDDVFLCC